MERSFWDKRLEIDFEVCTPPQRVIRKLLGSPHQLIINGALLAEKYRQHVADYPGDAQTAESFRLSSRARMVSLREASSITVSITAKLDKGW